MSKLMRHILFVGTQFYESYTKFYLVYDLIRVTSKNFFCKGYNRLVISIENKIIEYDNNKV
jgi:hypothetical protein